MATAEILESELCVLSAGQIAEDISVMIRNTIRMGMPVSFLPSMMLWGPPGVGKSNAIYQAAAFIERSTGKKVNVVDVRLLLFSPVDLIGLPVADAEKQCAIWLKPRIFVMDDSEDVVNILFLDEITAATPTMQATAYQLTLDRRVGEHKLPDNCFVVAAGNRTTDRSVSYKMPKALSNRLCHVEIEADFDAWKNWAIDYDIDPAIIGFLAYDPRSLMQFDANNDDRAFPTPRSWEMVSRFIKIFGSVDAALHAVTGCIGKAMTSAFTSWLKIWDRLPSLNDIFAGRNVTIPTGPDVLYALVASMVAYAMKKETSIESIVASVHTGVKLPADYAMLLFKSYMKLEDKCDNMRSTLVKNKEFSQWLVKNERYLNT